MSTLQPLWDVPTHQSGLGPIMDSRENRCLLVSTWNLAVTVPWRLSSPHRGVVFSTDLMLLLCNLIIIDNNMSGIVFLLKVNPWSGDPMGFFVYFWEPVKLLLRFYMNLIICLHCMYIKLHYYIWAYTVFYCNCM